MNESFPLTVAKVFREYTRMPIKTSDILYHYTTRAGLTGILKSGGFRATYRMRMNDPAEFEYARSLIFKTLKQIGTREDLPPIVQSLTTYACKKLKKFLENSTEISSAYCACLTIASDQQKQWKTYAENGKGFALGINMLNFLSNQSHAVGKGKPYVYGAPVTYEETAQCDLVCRLVKAGLRDIQAFADTCSQRPEDLTAIRDRVTQEIVIQLLSLIDFIKDPIFSSEKEFRLILDSNDGSLMAHHVQQYQSGEDIIPFVFIDLRDPTTKRLPLAEIKVGPNISFENERRYIEELLDELGYGEIHNDKPEITKSICS